MERPVVRVLLVEDDEDDYVITRDLLREIGAQRYELEWARTYEEGRAAIARCVHDVHLVDYRLGERDGLDLIRESIAGGCTAPLLLLTGQADDETDKSALLAGAADYLDKGQISAGLLERSIRYAIERARTVDALRRSENNFRNLIENAPDAIGVEREGRFVYVNSRMVALLGAAGPDELVGREVWEYIHPGDRVPLGKGSERWRPREMRLAANPATTIDVAGFPLLFDGAEAVVVFARDVSDRKRMQEKLILADRLASVGTLAAGVAHEINNPLASLIANLSLMQGQLEQAVRGGAMTPEAVHAFLAELREIVDESLEGADRVSRIVRDLKMVVRTEGPRGGDSDVREVLESALSVVGNEIRRTARLVRACEATPRVAANDSQLGQVFVNLLLNAVQALPDGEPDRNAITVATRTADDGSAVVEIADTGCGIPPESLPRLYDPFFTTKPVGTGTGLGLSICDGIVASLGGRIEVESEVGKGSLFRVILPPARGS